MAGNPMQRKARNYFILGLVIAGVIGAIGVGFLAYKIYNQDDGYRAQIEQLNDKFETKYYALNRDVKSMEEIKSEYFDPVQTIKGESIAPEDYMDPNEFDIAEVDENGEQIVNKDGEDVYIYPYHALTDLKAGTIVGQSMLYENEVAADERLVEYSVIALFSQAQTGDVVDIRMKLPSGVDFIVLPKKLIKIPQVAELDVENTIWLNLSEEEILLMDSAIVECYMIEGAYLYTTNYISAAQQNPATQTYFPSTEVMNIMALDTNMASTAYDALLSRFNDGRNRKLVEDAINRKPMEEDEARLGRIIAGMEKEVQDKQDDRRNYLDSLAEE